MNKKITISLFILLVVALPLTGIFLYGSHSRIVTVERGDCQIMIAGNLHIGSGYFWDKYSAIIQDFGASGSSVLYEATLSGCGLDHVMRPFRDMAQYTDTLYQDRGMDYMLNWQLCDITAEALDQFYGADQLKDLQKQIDVLKGLPAPIARFLVAIGTISAKHFERDPLVIERNKKPIITAIELAQTSKKIVIIYGEAHVDGIIQGLQQAGFKRVMTQTLYVY